jgi:hypothetical protein
VLLAGDRLRLLQCLRAGVQDLDDGRQEITVRNGEGAKDRVTMLPALRPSSRRIQRP